MQISVFGAGHVGLVTAACLAETGHDVVCMDIDAAWVRRLENGECPLYEPDLPSLFQRNLGAGRLRFSSDAAATVQASDMLFIAVGTPSTASGAADLGQVMAVADAIGTSMTRYKCVVMKSTVPVGTSAQVQKRIAAVLDGRAIAADFDVVSNPEFLKEGSAVDDCLRPDRIIIGCGTGRAREMMTQLYQAFSPAPPPLVVMDVASAELSKYAANAMLATRISFMNELAGVCERTGASIDQVRRGVGSDPRIGEHFLEAGLGYGGPCFPKDIRALTKAAEDLGENLTILRAVDRANIKQRERFFARLQRLLGTDLRQKRLAVWGLAFKPKTDDIRDAPSLDLVRWMLDRGAEVVACDPAAAKRAQEALAASKRLRFVDDPYDALPGADALCIVTEWEQFRAPDLARMQSLMRNFVVFDGRNVCDPAQFKKYPKASYVSVGRADTKAVAPQ